MKSIRDIKEEFAHLSLEELPAYIESYASDDRKGVRNLMAAQQKRLDRYHAEVERVESLCFYEKKYQEYIQGF